MTDIPNQTAEALAFKLAERHLRSELRDADCTGWTCPMCDWSQYKVIGMECDRCAFDAGPYMPKKRKV